MRSEKLLKRQVGNVVGESEKYAAQYQNVPKRKNANGRKKKTEKKQSVLYVEIMIYG